MTNVPEIRFDGFADAWEQRKLGEIADLVDGDRGKNYPTGEDFHSQGHTVFLSAANITKNGFSFESNQFISEEKSDVLGSGKLQLNDVVITSRGSLGHVAWYNEDAHQQAPFSRINSGMLLLRSKEDFEPSFIEQLLKSPIGQKQINLISFGSAQPQLTKRDITNYYASFPTKPEQIHIGNFFRTLDTTITLYKRKLDGLKRLKSAYLQQTFPQTGESVPRVRFEGFSDAWRTKNANEIFCAISEKGHSDLPVLSASQEYGMVLRDEIGIDIKFDSTNIATYKRVMPGQFVIHLRSFQGGLAYSNVEGITSPAYTILDFADKGSHVPEFWIDVLKSDRFIKMLESVTYGIRDGRSISFNDFSILQLSYPQRDEQIAISKFFRGVDNNITELQTKLDSLANLKSVYLSKMFI